MTPLPTTAPLPGLSRPCVTGGLTGLGGITTTGGGLTPGGTTTMPGSPGIAGRPVRVGVGGHGHVPALAALADQLYAEVQAMGGQRWDSSSLIQRLRGAPKQ